MLRFIPFVLATTQAFPKHQVLSVRHDSDRSTSFMDDINYLDDSPRTIPLGSPPIPKPQSAPEAFPSLAQLNNIESKPPFPTEGVTLNNGCQPDFLTCRICSSDPDIDCVPAKLVFGIDGIYRLCTLPGPYAEYCQAYQLPIDWKQKPGQRPGSKPGVRRL